MTFDEDLWPYLKPLSDSDIDAILEAAKSDKIYRLKLAGVFVAYVLGIAGISFAVPAFYRAYSPGISVKAILAVVVLAATWPAVILLSSITRRLFDRAVMRQIRANGLLACGT